MEKEDCISKNNRSLVSEISAKLNIKLNRKNPFDGYWSVALRGSDLIIEYGTEHNKEEAFTHELLHAKCQLNGFRKIKWAVSSADTDGYLKTCIEAMDNEFQHHKMYQDYLDMGYDPEKFYSINDKETERHILDYIKAPDRNHIAILTQYLTVTSAGSSLIFNNLQEIKDNFREIRKGRFPIVLDKVDEVIEKWKSNQSYDIKIPIKEIFSIIPKAQYTYFSFTEREDMSDGFQSSLPCRIEISGDGCNIEPI